MPGFFRKSKIQTNSLKRKRKSKRPTFLKYFYRNLRKFFETTTTLHGVKFIVHDNITIWERLFFLASFCIVVTAAFFLCGDIYDNWQQTPVITAMSPYTTPIMSMPFPSITICNMNNAKRSVVKNINVTSRDYAYLQLACSQPFNFSSYIDIGAEDDSETFGDFMRKVGQPCREMMIYCRFGTSESDCRNLFKEILVDEGLCCVFNAVHPSFLYKSDFKRLPDYDTSDGYVPVNWRPEKGYPDELPKYFYPRLAEGAGVGLGFTVVLNAHIDEYYCSTTNGEGFKLVLHNPIDRPFIKETGSTISIGDISRVIINTLSYKADDTVRDISPLRRQCLFDSESNLHYFKYYTRRNCEMECDAKFMIDRCNCLHFYMPQIYSNVSICTMKDFDCVYETMQQIDSIKSFHCKVNCLPSCNELSYLSNTFPTPFAKTEYGLQTAFMRNISKEYMSNNLAMVHFFFEDVYFRSYVKSSYTAFTDFLSQTGGVMSLFMGFSFISIAELLYFSIICPIFDIILKRPTTAKKLTQVQPENRTNSNLDLNDNLYIPCPPDQWSVSSSLKRGIATQILRRQHSRNIGNLRNLSNFKSDLTALQYIE